MRRPVDAERIRRFMRELGSEADRDVRLYFTGGATAVLLGWRPSTIDVDIKLEPELDRLFRILPHIKEQLEVNIELAAPDQFIPEIPGWQDSPKRRLRDRRPGRAGRRCGRGDSQRLIERRGGDRVQGRHGQAQRFEDREVGGLAAEEALPRPGFAHGFMGVVHQRLRFWLYFGDLPSLPQGGLRMRKLILLLLLAAGGFAAGLFSPPAAADNCVLTCSNPDPCGYVCCYQLCCGKRCIILDCAPPPPCEF